ncbi:hypothetical protein [Nocardia sp. NPDC004860]|uniref:hypothetical protein n=1 Tax=Nocardia sp. NPDC004860 TaxID=3154557 RepID=UPI0033BA215C
MVAGPGKLPPFLVCDGHGASLEPIESYFRDLALSDASPLTGKSYGYDLLWWFRLLWRLDLDWAHVSEAETALVVGWMRPIHNGAGAPRRLHRRVA